MVAPPISDATSAVSAISSNTSQKKIQLRGGKCGKKAAAVKKIKKDNETYNMARDNKNEEKQIRMIAAVSDIEKYRNVACCYDHQKGTIRDQ